MKKIIDVVAGVIIRNNKILLAKRKNGLHLGGYWEFPGGKIKNSETPEECLQRELLEELGIQTRVLEFLAENIHNYGGKTIRLKGYIVEYISGDFILSDHDEICWLTRDEITNYDMAPADVPLAKEVIKLKF